jgi:nitrite reductase/ring-hydroxylating ferredoxin subunit/uncharacterized membrane protein
MSGEKSMKRIIHGAPFRHPLHPGLVHYPIGLFLLTALFDLASLLIPGQEWAGLAAVYTLAGGAVLGLLAAVPGLIDWSEIRIDHPGKRTATAHMLLNLTATTLFLISLFMRAVWQQHSPENILPAVLGWIGMGVILVSGYLGGKLVYDEGIGVGRYRRKTNLPERTRRGNLSESQEGFVYIAEANELGEGETLRAEVNGEVVAIVQLEGQYYAFNEFCTHRFGPLSEGAFYGHKVECPWHRSCFDVRSGKAVEGPAKIDLKTYEVKLRQGKLYLRT